MAFRAEEPVGEGAVVTDEEKALAVLVQTPDGEEVPSPVLLDQVENRALLFVFGCG